MKEKGYSIGKVARKLKISQRRIIEYEPSGLLKMARQPRTNNRIFSEFDVQQVKSIQNMIHKHGFTLKSLLYMADLVPCWRLFQCGITGCPVYQRADKQCWQILRMNKKGECPGDCERCVVYLASKKVGKVTFLSRPEKK